jgi:formylglycine-generating enzyme required for sulfatase activity
LIYGPSGCGKSSLVKAGLLPRLASNVGALYVEGTPTGTETRLLRALENRYLDLPRAEGLVRTIARLRRQLTVNADTKVLIVLDQFEQWLQGRGPEPLPQLIEALRHCDGVHVQCVVLVRDDFWMAATRFMHDLEVPLVEGANSRAVDLFDEHHARKVLAACGRAFGRLPEDPAAQNREQQRFLDNAVAELASDGKVIPVRLSLFAEMMKGRPWTGTMLKEVGGSEGTGVAFLEDTFSAPTAPPEHRLHQQAARAVLKALLPEASLELKGHMRSRQELLEASGYSNRPREFVDLLHILDVELRLVTPADPEGMPEAAQSGGHYLLTHDYLVPSLREWLTRKQRETMHGRAEYQLADRTRLWSARPERRQLPGWWEWCRIRLLTSRKAWTDPERKMMRQAGRYHGLRAAVALVMVAAASWAIFEGYEYLRARSLVSALASAEPPDVPRIVDTIGAHRQWADGMLALMLTEGRPNSHQQILARAALAPADEMQVDPLLAALWTASPQDILIIRQALLPYRKRVVPRLWEHVQDQKAPLPERLRGVCALASLDPDNANWIAIGEVVATELASQNPLALPQWLAAIDRDEDGHPPLHVRAALWPSLCKTFRDSRKPADRVMATNILATFAVDNPAQLVDLLLDADPEQYRQFIPLLRQHSRAAIPLLVKEIERPIPSDESATDTLARRQAHAAVALVQLDWPELVWPLLRHSPDPSRRTYLIHDLARLGTKSLPVIERLLTETEVSARRALLLSLGEFDAIQLPDRERESLVPQLLHWYRNDPDPGVHSALDWLLRQNRRGATPRNLDWRERDAVDRIDRELAGQPPQHRNWYVNKEKQTFAILPDPDEFLMGAIGPEAERIGVPPPHRVKIGSFEIATKKVSVAEFRRFLDAHPEIKKPNYDKNYSPDDDGPILAVTWFEAAQYCNWLSQQQGIAEDEWCYSKQPARPAMEMREEIIKRSGYRLPTEAEWEFACRAGSTSMRFYGSSLAMLDEYAWEINNTQGERTWPLGQLKPNDFGLFDVYGNAWDWCQDRGGFADDDMDRTDRSIRRMIRGGSFISAPSYVFSGNRRWAHAKDREFNLGFRVARTYRRP